jgi:hypothetical protein
MFDLGIPCIEQEKCLPEKVGFRELMIQPINAILGKNASEDNACLKSHTFWSILHGLISIKMMRTSDMCDELNKMVLDDAINGFIKNLAP